MDKCWLGHERRSLRESLGILPRLHPQLLVHLAIQEELAKLLASARDVMQISGLKLAVDLRGARRE